MFEVSSHGSAAMVLDCCERQRLCERQKDGVRNIVESLEKTTPLPFNEAFHIRSVRDTLMIVSLCTTLEAWNVAQPVAEPMPESCAEHLQPCSTRAI
jgi:hypothetical protein